MPRNCPSPVLGALMEEIPKELDELDDLISNEGNDGCSSMRGSTVGSEAASKITDSRRSALTGGHSAFTAPPRYRNSGAFVHGTKYRNFGPIMAQGLKAANSDIFMIDEVRPDGRVPGLKEPPEILIFIDENKARSENMEFEYAAALGTWKTKGINGVIRPWFFQKVLDNRRGPTKGNVLFQSKEDPLMQANVIRKNQQPKYLIHATYWENVVGIMQEGILPAKNPSSAWRKPFKDLLQGAEDHVYTVSMAAASHTSIEKSFSRQISNSRVMDREVVPEETQAVSYRFKADSVGLERAPDAVFCHRYSKSNATRPAIRAGPVS